MAEFVDVSMGYQVKTLVVFGDQQTADCKLLPAAAHLHGHELVSGVFFGICEMHQFGGRATEHPATPRAVHKCMQVGAALWVPFVGDLGGPDEVVAFVVATETLGVPVVLGMDCQSPAEFLADSGLGQLASVVTTVPASIHDLVTMTAGASLAAEAIADAPTYATKPTVVMHQPPASDGIDAPTAMLADAGFGASEIVDLLHVLAVQPGEPARWTQADVEAALARRSETATDRGEEEAA